MYAWQMVCVIVKELISGQNDLQTVQFIFPAALSHSLSKGQHKSNWCVIMLTYNTNDMPCA